MISQKLSIQSTAVSYMAGNTILLEKASVLADRMRLNLVLPAKLEEHNTLLVYTEKGLQIQLKQDKSTKIPVTLHVDFLSDSLNYRRQYGGGTKQALARAVGIKPGVRPTILDVTAGLGKDSFLLASLGCKVTMVERSPLLWALLQDGLERAAASSVFNDIVAKKLNLIQGDAIIILNKEKNKKYETIYLDPMYPHSNKSALNKQEMRIIRTLVGNDTDSNKLLEEALKIAKRRVVVKRPKGAKPLNSVFPSHVIKMKNSRYDVYMRQTKP